MRSPRREGLLAAAALALVGGHAAAQPGSTSDPIVVHMKRGTDSVTLRGRLSQQRECCAYSFSARAGQTLIWSVRGPAYRVTIRYPNGDADGPGLPARIALPDDGTYIFRVSPNLMAEGAFGRFVLKLRIPPLKEATPGGRP
ncbi:MAG: hypothetical protein ACHP84_04840 [Caulobacterales bacterium]